VLKLTFDRGTIQIQGDVRAPNSTWDERSKTYRAMALYYRDIIDFLKASGFEFRDDVLNLLPCPELQSSVVLRDYQNQALDAWIANGNRERQNACRNKGRIIAEYPNDSNRSDPRSSRSVAHQADEGVQDRGRGIRWRRMGH
jgi:hypothetical protein